MSTEAERTALLKTFPPCDCGSIDARGDDIGEHSPDCPYHLAAIAAFGPLPTPDDGGWRRGQWMQTYTGRAFYPLDPRTDDIHPMDIAHSLGMQCRYNGHTTRFYSVAEHCVLMSDWILSEMAAERFWAHDAHDLALWALLHDAAEAYIGDMVRPLKLHQPAFRDIDDSVTAKIAQRFELSRMTIPSVVKTVDTRILLDERAALLATPPLAWVQDGFEPLGVKIIGWEPSVAKWEWLTRLEALTGRDIGSW